MLDGLGARKASGEAYAKSCSDIVKNPKVCVENNPKGFSLQPKMVLKIMLFCVAVCLLRFVYVITQGEGGGGSSCDGNGEQCVVNAADVMNHIHRHASVKSDEEYIPQLQMPNRELKKLWTTRDWRRKVDIFSVLFQGLIKDGFLKPESKALCIGAEVGQEVLALKEIGVVDAVGIDLVPLLPLVIQGDKRSQPFEDNTFDFEFSDIFDRSPKFVSEIERTLKPGGVAVIHVNDLNSIDSLVTRFTNSVLVRVTNVDGLFSRSEVVLKKTVNVNATAVNSDVGMLLEKPSWEIQPQEQGHNCPVPSWKRDAINKAEPLIEEEPLKPWITLKKNAETIKYLPTMADIGNRRKYVYIDVGARSYGSSIGGWFMKRYPQQNKTFDVYAIEADPAFKGGYRKRKGIKLLPYAAWVRNESLSFEINRDAGSPPEGKGMGRIQPTNTASSAHKDVISVQAFDFAEWLKTTVSAHDFVVMKMDVEGTEFDLLPRMFQTGAICLIDELFLECHYNRWQRCCPERTPKYKWTYRQCFDLFNLLRSNGVLVHQWW